MVVFVTIDLACSSGCCGRIELVKDDVSNEAIELSRDRQGLVSFENGGVSHVPGADKKAEKTRVLTTLLQKYLV